MVLNLYKYRLAVFIIGFILAAAVFWYKIEQKPEPEPAPQLPPEIQSGELLTWSEVDIVFPLYAKASVYDFEKHLQFRVQRRGGNSHADVQPLTAADTAIMKRIYDGQWTWRRRAVIIKLDSGQSIAASMNGMPHGQGAIKNNQFNGHFCIHFYNSKTHTSKKVDLAHQMMIWKAAGALDQQLALLEPARSVEAFFVAMNQGDVNIASHLVSDPKNLPELFNSSLRYIRVNKIEKLAPNSFNVELRVSYKDSPGEFSKQMIIYTVQSPYWKLETKSLTGLWARDSWSEVSPAIDVFSETEDTD